MSDLFPKDKLKVWAVDSLDKVFLDTPAPRSARKEVQLDAARGEVVSGQIALRMNGMTFGEHTTGGCGIDSVTVGPLSRRGVRDKLPVETRWVAWTYVPDKASGVAQENLEGTTPGLYPDPLYPVHSTSTHPHHYNPDHSAAIMNEKTRALWLTVRVPRSAKPGLYKGQVEFKIAYFDHVVRVPVSVLVHAAKLPTKFECGVENWFALASVARQHEVEWFSPEFWRLTEAYLRNLVDHYQTHIVVPMYELISFRAGRNGDLTLGWRRFDQFVELALKAGLKTLVGNHLATYTYNGFRYKCGVHSFRVKGRDVLYELHEGRTPRARKWLEWFLPRLRRHLKARGWLRLWWQHVRDEPGGIIEDYEAIREAVRELAPEFRTIDALGGPIVKGCDCWVPLLPALKEHGDFFRERQAAGDTVWTYVCCGPTGRYANRFTDQKTVLSRLIFWIMAKWGVTGYLHWGYNWSALPISEIDSTTFLPSQGPVQSGDVCVVYPGPHGPHDSIRWEQQREGIQDYELLRLLAKRDPDKAAKICSSIVRDIDRYNTGTAAFRAARRDLLEALSD